MLPLRTSVSATLGEKALRAHVGLAEWQPMYDDVLPRPETTTARMSP